MIELIKTYGPYVVGVLAWIGTNIPFIKKRIINDEKLIGAFTQAKEMLSKADLKETKVGQLFIKAEETYKDVERLVNNLDERLNNSIKSLDQSINNFMESELYKKMLDGLSDLDDLKQLLVNKDDTIKYLGNIIKQMFQKIQEIENKLR